MKYTTDILSEIQTWCHYADTVEEITYGALYNWYAADDARDITSVGWHLPDNTEWGTLITYLGGTTLASIALKESGTTYWHEDNNGNNSSGFNARGSGMRNDDGTYLAIKENFELWSADAGYDFGLAYFVNTWNLGGNGAIFGFGLRPIKDSTTLTNGQTGTYTDPSGYVYRTICIGTQEWVADNIKTEHYRNGDAIPVVTDNATWAALVTGAMCYYDNDISNA